MLDLTSADRRTNRHHQRFMDEGLEPEVHQRAFDAFDPDRYTARDLRRGRSAWSLRTLDEYRSQIGFTHLLSDLAELGVPFDILGTGTRVIRDEARHVELCRRMTVALGGTSELDGTPRFVRADAKLDVERRVLFIVAGSLCIGETISTRMLAAVRDTCVDPLARDVMTVLVADESVHGQFGWTVLEHLLPRLSRRGRKALDAWLPAFIRGAERAMAPVRQRTDDADPLIAGPRSPFGSLGPAPRAALFHRSLDLDVVRRLDALGLDGTGALSRSRRLRAA